MKNAIFTSSDAKYGDFLIHAWLKSLKANADLSNAEVIVLDYGFSGEQRKKLEKQNVTVLQCERNGHVVSLRFRDMADYLKNHSFDQVLSTDGGDIIFQTDLKELFESNKNDFRAVCEDMHLPFGAVFIDPFFSKEYAKKIKKTIRGKKNGECRRFGCSAQQIFGVVRGMQPRNNRQNKIWPRPNVHQLYPVP